MNRLKRILSLAAAGAALSLFAACGGSDEPAPSAAQALSEEGVVVLTANDQMKFSQTEIRAKAGEVLKLRLTNIGKMPKQAMSHNWALLTPMSDSEINAFAIKAANNPPSYLPKDASAVIAHTAMLGGGESDTIEFTVPPAGSYPFICTFPGHAMIMRGVLVSQ